MKKIWSYVKNKFVNKYGDEHVELKDKDLQC